MSLGLVHDKEAAAEEYARQVAHDLSVLSHSEFLFKWSAKSRKTLHLKKSVKSRRTLKKKSARGRPPTTTGSRPPLAGGVYLVRSAFNATLETGDEVQPGQVLYVGQSSYLPDRINHAHMVLYFLRETGIEFYLEYQIEDREKERLFLEAREIAAYTPPLQFGGVPAKYKGERSGAITKNTAISPDNFDLLLGKLEGRNKKIAVFIFATGKGFAEAKEATGYRHERQVLARDLARNGCNIYQLKMGSSPQALPERQKLGESTAFVTETTRAQRLQRQTQAKPEPNPQPNPQLSLFDLAL
jgi:hypothetical protein